MCQRLLLITTAIFLATTCSIGRPALAQKGKGSNNAQERKDDAKIKSEKEDVSEAQQRIQESQKDLRDAEAELKKSLGLVAAARKAMDDQKDRLEETLGPKLGLPKAVLEQQIAQQEIDSLSKPVLVALGKKPEFAAASERAAKALKRLDELATRSDLDPATKKQQASEASNEVTAFRTLQKSELEMAVELKEPHNKLTAAQIKLSELRKQLRKQVDAHPDLLDADQKWGKAKAEHEKVENRLTQLRNKAAAEQKKLAAEKSQLQNAVIQDRRNDNDKKPNQKNNKPKN